MTLVGRPGRQHPRRAEDWRRRAACLGAATRLFFPDESRETAGYAEARQMCAVCPVREECLEEALAVNEQHGMWGGMNPWERREEVKAREWLAYREQRMAFA